jgi:chromosomal replication initiation ATPase DnaA
MKITMEMIAERNWWLRQVSELTGVAGDDMMTASRIERISMARQLVMWALYEMNCYTTVQTGTLMMRNHATVTYAVGHINGGYCGKNVERIKNELIKRYNQRRLQ